MIFVKDENRRIGGVFQWSIRQKGGIGVSSGFVLLSGVSKKKNCCKIVANILSFFGDFCLRNTIYFNRKQKLANKPKGA